MAVDRPDVTDGTFGPTRRRLLAAGAGLLAAGAGCLGAPTGEPTDDPSPGPGPLDWAVPLGTEPGAAPVAVDGAAVVGGAGGDLVAFEADGSARWRRSLDRPVKALTAAGDLVLATLGTTEFDSDDEVLAVAAADGDDAWRVGPGGWWLRALGRHDDTVYVATGDDHVEPDGEHLYAYGAADGTVRWDVEVGDTGEALLTDDGLVVPTYGRLYAYGHDGTRRWTVDDVEYNANSAAAAGGTVAASVDAGEERFLGLGLGAADGSERWRVDDRVVTSALAADGELYLGGEHVAAVDPATGEDRWRYDPGGSLYDGFLHDGQVFAGGDAVVALSRDGGEAAWSFAPDGEFLSPVGVADGTLFVHGRPPGVDAARNTELWAVEAGDGARRWTHSAARSLADPVLVDGTLVTVDAGGTVLAVRA